MSVYFGKPRDAPAWESMRPAPTPVGQHCIWCDEPIVDGDDGTINFAGQVSHADCWVRQAIGGVNHILRLCSCCGGSQPPDPEGMTPRQAATTAVRVFNEMHGLGGTAA